LGLEKDPERGGGAAAGGWAYQALRLSAFEEVGERKFCRKHRREGQVFFLFRFFFWTGLSRLLTSVPSVPSMVTSVCGLNLLVYED
jgi:hypothetical protein